MKTTRTYLILAFAAVMTAAPNTLHASAAWGLASPVRTSIITAGGALTPAAPAAKVAAWRAGSARHLGRRDRPRP